jgi:hypothetical protein
MDAVASVPDSTAALTRLQARLGPRYPLAPADRVLITEGMLFEDQGNGSAPTSNVREAFLCSDALVLVSQASKAELSVGCWPLKGAMIEDLAWRKASEPATLEDAMRLSVPGCKPVTLVAPDSDYKLLWLKHFRTALSAVAEDDGTAGWVHSLVKGTLFYAAVANDAAVAQALVDRRDAGSGDVDVNAVDDEGGTPLQYAVSRGHVAVATVLVRASAALEAVSADYETPLHVAARRADAGMVSLLSANGALPDARDLVEQTPLHIALGAAAPPAAVIEVTRLLLTNGADATAADAAGLQPLHLAVLNGLGQAVRLLVRHGADPNAAAEFVLPASPRGSPRSDLYAPLHLALTPQIEAHLLRGPDATAWPRVVNPDLVSVLLAHGAQANGVSGTLKQTPMHLALIAAGHLKRGASTPESSHQFALLQAASTQLAAAGGRIDIPDAAGQTCAPAAEAAGLRPALEAACRSFSSRGAPSDVARISSRLEHVIVTPGSAGNVLAASLMHRLRMSTSPQQHVGTARRRLGIAANPSSWSSTSATESGCSVCGVGFSLLKRKHHVRISCALVSCSMPCSMRMPSSRVA